MYTMKYFNIQHPFLPTSNFLQFPQHRHFPNFISSFLIFEEPVSKISRQMYVYVELSTRE